MGDTNLEKKLRRKQLKEIERLEKQSQHKERENEFKKIRAFKLLANILKEQDRLQQVQQLHEIFPDISAAAETYVFKPKPKPTVDVNASDASESGKGGNGGKGKGGKGKGGKGNGGKGKGGKVQSSIVSVAESAESTESAALTDLVAAAVAAVHVAVAEAFAESTAVAESTVAVAIASVAESTATAVARVPKTRITGPRRGPSTKKLAAIAAAAAAESEVVEMVREMKSAFIAVNVDVDVADVDVDVDVADVAVAVAAAADVANTEGEILLTEEPYVFESESEMFSNYTPLEFQDDCWIEDLRLDLPETHVATVEAIDVVVATVATVATVAALDVAQIAPKRKQKSVYRHEFSAEVFAMLTAFTTENAHLDRKSHKLAWTKWVADHEEIIAGEAARLQLAGYTGDALDKMFKTCRYYVSKREKSPKGETVVRDDQDDDETESDESTVAESVAESKSTKTKTVARARAYIPIDKAVLQSMDEHIIMLVLNAETDLAPKPSECYSQYCRQFSELIAAETARLTRVHIGDADKDATATTAAAADKLKKTYKNRMFAVQSAH